MEKFQKYLRVGERLLSVIMLILFASTAQAQMADSPKHPVKGFCQFYGGTSFPNVSPTDKGWDKGRSYGLRIGVSYKWLQLSIDVADFQFEPRNQYWSEVVKEIFTEYSNTVRFEARYENGKLVYYREWRKIINQPDEVSLETGGEFAYRVIGMNLFAMKNLTKVLSVHAGPGIAYYTSRGEDMKFSVWWKDDATKIHPIVEAPPSKTHFGMNLKAGIDFLVGSFASAQLEIAFHDMFKTREKYKFLSVQGGLSFALAKF